MPRPPRLIDLHCDWLLQYTPETTLFDPTLYSRVSNRLPQIEGYLGETSAAVLSCYRRPEDWTRQADPWHALGELIARIEAEFPGRLLIGPDDHKRYRDDPHGLCWGILGVEGFDSLVRSPADLAHLPLLFHRGVRVFQPVDGPTNLLAGSSAAHDNRSLTPLGQSFLQTLADLEPEHPGPRPRPVLDLAHMNPASIAEVLDWFEADPLRLDRVTPLYSHGALRHDAYTSPRAITLDNLRRLRALGGLIGFSVAPPFHTSPEALKAGILAAAELPFQGRIGFEGIAIGTDFLAVDSTLPGLSNAADVAAWLMATFGPHRADQLIRRNASRLLAQVAGALPSTSKI